MSLTDQEAAELQAAFPASPGMIPPAPTSGIDPALQALYPASPDLWRTTSVAQVTRPAAPPAPPSVPASSPSTPSGTGGPDDLYPATPQMRESEATPAPQQSPAGDPTPQQLQQSAGDPAVPPGFDPALYSEYQAITEAAKLPPGSAKAILDLHAKAIHASQVAHAEHVTRLAEAARVDPELSADWVENLRVANSVLTRYEVSSGLLDALKTTGLGNHPELIRLLKRVGRDLQL